MRNWLTYNLARASGRYASRTVWTEVFLVDDGAATLAPSHYHGIYIGLEKIKVVSRGVGSWMARDEGGGGTCWWERSSQCLKACHRWVMRLYAEQGSGLGGSASGTSVANPGGCWQWQWHLGLAHCHAPLQRGCNCRTTPLLQT